jgi:tetratricopeptide (TPR) repeat protein/predicted AlkP superfamily phosphohydrolase/phosphomutase
VTVRSATAALALTLLVVAGAGCGRGPGSERATPAPAPQAEPAAGVPERNLLFIGLDGADWDIIDPLVAQGRLPHLARLAREGTRARLRTVTPILSPVVWTSIATGKGPAKHGIIDFLARASDGSMVPVTSSLRRARAVWNILGDAGVPVAVTAWWATWPAERVRGFMATDRIAYQLFRSVAPEPSTDPATDARGKTWPPELYGDLEPRVVRPDAVTDDQLASWVDFRALGEPTADDRERIDELRTIVASTRTYEAIGAELLRRQPRGFHAVYNESTDTVAHLFMPFRPPRRHDVDRRRAAAFGAVVDAAYREADAWVGRMLERVGRGWTVIVASDHGFKHGDNRPTTDPRVDHGPGADWHDRFGILILWGPDIRSGARVADASVLDLTPTILALYGLPVGEDMDGRVLEEALEPAFLAAHPPRTVPTYERGGAPPGPVEPSTQDPELIAKLRALGYLGSGSDDPDAGRKAAPEFSQDSARAFNNRGVILMTQHDLPAALAEFEKGLRAGGGIQSLVNIAQVHILEGRLDDAERTLAEIERLDPDARMLPGLEGAVANLRGDDSRAKRLLREAIRIDPADSRSHSRLGHILETEGKLDEGLAEFESAIRADPDDAEARNYAGNVLRLKGDAAGAEARFREAIAVDPRYPGAYNNLGLVLQQTGRRAEAVELYRKGLEQAPGSPLLHNSLGSLLILEGDLEGAEREVRKALELDPEMAEARNNLGILLAERGQTRAAAEAFRRALAADPRNVDAHFNLAKIALIEGDREQALREFERTLEIAPSHFEAALGAAETAFRMGRDRDAVRFFERALDLRPDSPRVLRRLGELYLRAGDRARAADRWKRSLALEPGQPDLARRLRELDE